MMSAPTAVVVEPWIPAPIVATATETLPPSRTWLSMTAARPRLVMISSSNWLSCTPN